MATYTLTAKPSGSSQDNDATRIISDLWAYDSTKYKTITSITRTNGVWCSCGGTSQSVVVNVYGQLLINGTEYMKADVYPTTCKSYGSGPSSDNYATTTFTVSTTAQSNALIAAWNADTLQIKWTLEIKSSTSSKRGTPSFRSGQYNDVITLVGEDVPPTDYKPVIDTFNVVRVDADTGNVSTSGTSVKCTIKLSMNNDDGLNDNPHLYLCYMENSDPIYGQSEAISVDLTNNIPSDNLSNEITVMIEKIEVTSDYHFGLVFTAGDETSGYVYKIAPKSSVPLHINKTNSGVGIGGYSKSETASDRRVDVHWPLYLYDDIHYIKEEVSYQVSLEAGTLLYGHLTGSKTTISLSIPIAYIPSNAVSASIESMVGYMRCSGYYGLTEKYSEGGSDYTSWVQEIVICHASNMLRVNLVRNSGFYGTNNYPVIFDAYSPLIINFTCK